MNSRTRHAGFTLIELMIVVIVLAILASLAAPSFSDAIDRARLKSKVSGVVDVLEFAKSEAMKRSKNVTVTIIGSTNSDNTWSVVADALVFDPVTQQDINENKKVEYSASDGVTLSPSGTLALTFRGIASGSAIDSDLTMQSRKGLQVRIRINPIGGIMVCSVGSSLWSYPSC